jgi:hypothetical protein
MPIDQTMRGLALEIDASTDPAPEAQPLLEYRFINLANTQTILARIKGTPRPDGGGQLAFEIDAGAGTTTQRMLIDNNGNVGIGTGNPGARLDVVGGANFNGPLNVQGALTASGLAVSGDARVGGDLSVTGTLTAASFKGNGAGLSNVTLADHSIISAKLAQDAASLSKVSGGKMVITGGNVTVKGITNTEKLQLGNKWLLSGVGDAHANDDWLRLFNTQGTGYFGGFAAGKLYSGTTTFTEKLQLGNKWLLSGEGDAHANDDWLRLFNIQGTGYFGGFAAGRLWTIGGTVQGSDLRLKTNVSSLFHMVDKLLALRAVRFKWRNAREDDSYRIGLIAQEVESVLPEVIETGPDGMKGINESGLVAAIITAIKEQQAELCELRAEIALLRAT